MAENAARASEPAGAQPAPPSQPGGIWVWLLLALWCLWVAALAWLGHTEWRGSRPADRPAASPHGQFEAPGGERP
ncbi:MAG: hypothetical protein M5U26_06865 [Planctomycetota bacterium]|nr:hypothetical protein [Planctomycetota bacterium]